MPVLILAWLGCLGGESQAQWLKEGESELSHPLIDGEPFDLLFLNQQADNAIIKIKPLGSEMPSFPLAQRGQLVFEYYADYDEPLEVPYSSIAQIKTFNEMLLVEADAWVKNMEYSKAFRNLLFVYDHGGATNETVVELLRDCMFLDATNNFSNGDFELSLSIYEDIYSRDPEFQVPGFDKPLIEIILLCYDGIINKLYDAEEYLSVRRNVASVIEKYPEATAEFGKQWEAKFLERSNQLLAESNRYASENRGRLAHQAVRKADQMVPDRPEVLAQEEKLLKQFPLIIVGVSQAAGDADPNQIEHWGARRVGRLIHRRMVELTGLSDEGGKYMFLNGTMYRTDEAGMKYTFELHDDESRFAVPPISAFEISMRLLSRGNPDSPAYDPAWGKIVDQVMIEDESRVSVTLRSPFVRPEALLSMTYQGDLDEVLSVADQDGAYVLASQDDAVSTFELNPKYMPIPGRQHPVVVEQRFAAASIAVDELMRGNVDVVDRIPIADVARLKADPNIVIRPYILPTVHMLIPKIREPELADDPNFRSGLSYAIDRDLIVRDVLCGRKQVDGCEPISGPFPLGTEDNDQISYGYDLRAKPLAYNERLGMVLTELAMRANPPKRPEPIKPPSLTIVHPRSSAATEASGAIARMWTQAGFPTETRALKLGQSIPDDPNWDFLYLEVTIEEPLADAARIIGSQGFAPSVSAPVEQTLRILNYSRSWQTACAALRRLHRQVRVDLSVIPLWQLTEHYAYRNTVRNVGRNIIHLYQNVDRWKIDLTAEAEEELP